MSLRLVHPQSSEELDAALMILFSEFSPEEYAARRQDLESVVERGNISLAGLLVAMNGDRFVGAALWSPQPDRTALIWPPVVQGETGDEEAVRELLMNGLTNEIDAENLIAQAMLATEETDTRLRLLSSGFVHAAQLFFLGRAVDPHEIIANRTTLLDWKVTTYGDIEEQRFIDLIEQTYLASLDCPFMSGQRTAAEAVAGHRKAGVFNPDHWMLFSDGQGDAAVLLLADHPATGATELVYMGVAPAFRGKGYGTLVLQQAIETTRRLGRETLFLAVDSANHYASKIYREQGFVELVKRDVFLREPRRNAAP